VKKCLTHGKADVVDHDDTTALGKGPRSSRGQKKPATEDRRGWLFGAPVM
jgi:hypothetical protein